MNRVRVLVAEDNPGVLAALRDLLSFEDSVDLVASAGDADQAIALTQRLHPDVALVDVRMPGGGGERVAREARRQASGTRIIVLTAHEEREVVLHLLESGVMGYVVKGAPADEIIAAIHRCAAGRPSLSPQVASLAVREIVGDAGGREPTSRRRLEGSLRRNARSRPWLTMVYQPIANLVTRRVAGVEALARFSLQPEWGPAVWFGHAADVGLGVEMELRAMTLALDCLDRLPSDWFLSINVSPATLASSGFARALSGVPDRVMAEVTEHVQVPRSEELGRVLAAFRAEGGRVALDDATAGMASLWSVAVLSPEMIKLDMSLTRGIDRDPTRRRRAAALIAFAAEAGATIAAEGIETATELEALRDLGVAYGQGFYLGRPGPLRPEARTAPALLPASA